MKPYIPIVCNNQLFHTIEEADLPSLLTILHAFEEHFEKNTYIHLPPNPNIGIILQGTLQISKHDFQGNKMLLASLTKGDLFAEVFAISQTQHIPIEIQVSKDAHILWIPYQHMLATMHTSRIHVQLIKNLLQILASKNLMLNKKMEYLSLRTLEERILTYLHDISDNQHSLTFEIPFNRQELADYLCVDRSALSRELSKLQKQGKLTFHKSTFTLINKYTV